MFVLQGIRYTTTLANFDSIVPDTFAFIGWQRVITRPEIQVFYHCMMVKARCTTVVITSRTVKLIKISNMAVFVIHLGVNRLQTIQKTAPLINRQVQIIKLPVRHSFVFEVQTSACIASDAN